MESFRSNVRLAGPDHPSCDLKMDHLRYFWSEDSRDHRVDFVGPLGYRRDVRRARARVLGLPKPSGEQKDDKGGGSGDMRTSRVGSGEGDEDEGGTASCDGGDDGRGEDCNEDKAHKTRGTGCDEGGGTNASS